MFLRTKTVKNGDGTKREYLLLVESRRVNGKIQQKTLSNFGRVDVLSKSGLADMIAGKISEYCQTKELIDLAQEGQADWSKEYGSVYLLRNLWERVGFSDLFYTYLQRYRKRTDLAEAIFLLVAGRLLDPGSERYTYAWKKSVYEPKWDSFEIQHLYRALDFLIDHKRSLEEAIYSKTVDLFNHELDLMMFDTTSLKYWGEGTDSNILAHGHSKERRQDLKQLIIGILMTKDGIPVAHEVWPGNTADVKSFQELLRTVKSRYKIGKLIWVCDRGMISQENLNLLNEWGQEYIFGVKMRQFSREKRAQLLTRSNLTQVAHNLFVREVEIKGQGRYIVCYNPEEAEHERNKREYFKKIIQDKIEQSTMKEWIMKNGYKKYIDILDGEIKLNEERLEKEEFYDGYWVLLTNTKLRSHDAALYYKGLWQIEAGFKSLKNELETGPVYHHLDRRIRAHVFICFLALVLKCVLKNKIKNISAKTCFSEVFNAVKGIKAVKLTTPKQEIIFRTEFPPLANVAFQAAGIAPPNRVLYHNKPNVVGTSG